MESGDAYPITWTGVIILLVVNLWRYYNVCLGIPPLHWQVLLAMTNPRFIYFSRSAVEAMFLTRSLRLTSFTGNEFNPAKHVEGKIFQESWRFRVISALQKTWLVANLLWFQVEDYWGNSKEEWISLLLLSLIAFGQPWFSVSIYFTPFIMMIMIFLSSSKFGVRNLYKFRNMPDF